MALMVLDPLQSGKWELGSMPLAALCQSFALIFFLLLLVVRP